MKTFGYGFMEHVCRISGLISKKGRGHLMLNKFEAVSLNQPVSAVVHI